MYGPHFLVLSHLTFSGPPLTAPHFFLKLCILELQERLVMHEIIIFIMFPVPHHDAQNNVTFSDSAAFLLNLMYVCIFVENIKVYR